MNGLTKEIASLLNITIEEALKVQEIVEEAGFINLSEATQMQINKAIKEAYIEHLMLGYAGKWYKWTCVAQVSTDTIRKST